MAQAGWLLGWIGALAAAAPALAAPLPPPPPPLPPPLPSGGGSSRGQTGGPDPVAEVLVDLSEQRLSAFDSHHRLLYRRPVSTGVAASPTPTGSFTVAARYAATPMTGRDYHIPSVSHVLCLAGDGLAPDAICIHPAPWQEAAGEAFGVRRSHGCVRTSSATARWLFERTPVGTPVIIQP
ncbi:MAG: L,D-transpeptidase [Cyanobacteriota bacterium]|nr:L,D-transpeptidase [Cyanobacteriota bacterium]